MKTTLQNELGHMSVPLDYEIRGCRLDDAALTSFGDASRGFWLLAFRGLVEVEFKGVWMRGNQDGEWPVVTVVAFRDSSGVIVPKFITAPAEARDAWVAAYGGQIV